MTPDPFLFPPPDAAFNRVRIRLVEKDNRLSFATIIWSDGLSEARRKQ
jgi:hypothetical protein